MNSVEFLNELRLAVGSGVRLVLVATHEEQRLRALLREAFGEAHLGTWSVTTGLDGDRSLHDPVAAIERATATGTPRVWLFCDLHPYMDDARVLRALRDFCASSQAARSSFVLVSPVERIPVELEREITVLPLPLPDASELDALLGSELRTVPGGASPDRPAFVRAALGLTLDEARRAFRLALAIGNTNHAVQRIIAQKQHALRRSSTLELVTTEVTLEDVGGLEVLKAWLRSRVLAYDRRARAFGLEEPRGMLVCGVQGCGKSLVSKAAARVLGLPLVRLDFADVFAAPSPERAMREAMRVVEAVAPVVLWVDEVEKGLGGGGNAEHVHVFGAFLTWLQERRAAAFVAATANEVELLPPELARRGRFDEVFFVDLPSAKERQDILELHLTRRGRKPADFSLEELSKVLENFSGAELEQVISSGLFRAYAQKRELTDADLRSASREVVPLAVLYEEKVQALRAWGKARARRASADRRTLELFGS